MRRPLLPLCPGSLRRRAAAGYRPLRRGGLTIVEMLVATLLTLIMLFAITQIFSMIGDSVNTSRSTIEMAAQLRSAAATVHTDLRSLTIKTLPWADATSGPGYFEVIEGPDHDERSDLPEGETGDLDDILAMTVTSRGEPYRATLGGAVYEAHVAEVIYFIHTDAVGRHSLIRKVLPLDPRLTGMGALAQRSLDDVTLRQNRFARGGQFPYPLDVATLTASVQPSEVILRGVLSFDVRVFDPMAPLRDGRRQSGTGSPDSNAADNPLGPSDAGYSAAPAYTMPRAGAYVDLNHQRYSGVSTGHFAGPPRGPLNGNTSGWSGYALWDTWPLYYEHDGIDQDGDGVIDNAAARVDKNNQFVGVDDPRLRETQPPYAYPLRGIQVSIKVKEPGTNIVRQSTVTASFLPE